MEIEYTQDQIAEHNKPGDAWIIIEEKVYDISKYLWILLIFNEILYFYIISKWP